MVMLVCLKVKQCKTMGMPMNIVSAYGSLFGEAADVGLDMQLSPKCLHQPAEPRDVLTPEKPYDTPPSLYAWKEVFGPCLMGIIQN